MRYSTSAFPSDPSPHRFIRGDFAGGSGSFGIHSLHRAAALKEHRSQLEGHLRVLHRAHHRRHSAPPRVNWLAWAEDGAARSLGERTTGNLQGGLNEAEELLLESPSSGGLTVRSYESADSDGASRFGENGSWGRTLLTRSWRGPVTGDTIAAVAGERPAGRGVSVTIARRQAVTSAVEQMWAEFEAGQRRLGEELAAVRAGLRSLAEKVQEMEEEYAEEGNATEECEIWEPLRGKEESTAEVVDSIMML